LSLAKIIDVPRSESPSLRKTLLTLIILLSVSLPSNAALVDPRLRMFGAPNGLGGVQKVLVLTQPIGGFNVPTPQKYNRYAVIQYSKQLSKISLDPVLQSLATNQLPGVRLIQTFWINGSFSAEVTPQGLDALSKHPSVSKIYLNARLQKTIPQPGMFGATPVLGEEYNFKAAGLDRLASELPQVNGKDVIVAVSDTGVDGNHPFLQGKIAAFYDALTKQSGMPIDHDRHGTHVSGIIVGSNGVNRIGVAPGAKLAMTSIFGDYSTVLEGMQWILDLERNPTVAQRVKVSSCSWQTSDAPDQEPFYRALASWEAAGILAVFSAGNKGEMGLPPPHEHPGVLTVANFGPNGQIAADSSRGPGQYCEVDAQTGAKKCTPTQKPDIAAPGVNILSSFPDGQLERLSGTSMSAPAVSGYIALMLQVNPNLTPLQIKNILLRTAQPLPGGMRGVWNRASGFGRVDAYSAVKMALTLAQQMGAAAFRSFSLFNTPQSIEQAAFDASGKGDFTDSYQYGLTDLSRWGM
jgi:subtilisin family serine protease